MRGMTPDALLGFLVELGVPAAKKLRAERQEALELQGASRKALAGAAIQGRTNDGRGVLQTLITAAAFDGDGPVRVSSKRKAEILGIHPANLTAGRKRAKALRPDLPPAVAMDQGAFWFQPRAKRSDETPPELVALMKRFWHTDGVSRASGNSKDVYRESKSADAVTHARRRLAVQGGGEAVFPMFSEWPDYVDFKRAWKLEKGEDIKDPGRTLFLSTRCKCITTPRVD